MVWYNDKQTYGKSVSVETLSKKKTTLMPSCVTDVQKNTDNTEY